MRLIDRVGVIAIGLILIGLITVVAIAPESLQGTLASIEDANLLLRVAVVVVLNILILIALYLILRSPKKPITGLAVRAPGAYTDVSIESARKLILAAVENVPDVVSANATVKAVNGKADVDMDVQVAGIDIQIPVKQKEINRALRQVIQKQLGLQMRGQPRVHLYLQGENPPLMVEAPVMPDPILAETSAPPQPVAQTALPSAPPVVIVDKDDDTLLKDEQANIKPPEKKEEKPGLFDNLFGARDADVESPAVEKPASEGSDDWLNSYTSERDDDDKDKPGDK